MTMNWASKTKGIILPFIGIVIWIMLAIAGISVAFYRGPYIFYSARSPSLKEECNEIRPGMNVRQVLAITSKRTEPFDEGISSQEMYFSRGDATCHVELDPPTLKVKRSYVREDTPIR
jgi:hypothetical protein